jgi:hypothetical protein
MTNEKPPMKPAPRIKSRRHGYRGYGSPLHREPGGVIHYPHGFTGVEFPNQGTALPRTPQVVSDELREQSREDSPTKP